MYSLGTLCRTWREFAASGRSQPYLFLASERTAFEWLGPQMQVPAYGKLDRRSKQPRP